MAGIEFTITCSCGSSAVGIKRLEDNSLEFVCVTCNGTKHYGN